MHWLITHTFPLAFHFNGTHSAIAHYYHNSTLSAYLMHWQITHTFPLAFHFSGTHIVHYNHNPTLSAYLMHWQCTLQ